MKAILATATVILSLLGAHLSAADSIPATIPVGQLFEQADVELVIEQYKRLQMAAFDIELKFATEAKGSPEQREQIHAICRDLQDRAKILREVAIKKAAAATTTPR